MRAAPVAILLGCAALAGCGGSGRAPAAPTATPAAPPARQAPPPGSAPEPLAQLEALAAIGARNRGTRAAATPGGVATEALIADRLRAAGFAVRFADVRFPFFYARRPPLCGSKSGPRPRGGPPAGVALPRGAATSARSPTRPRATFAPRSRS